MSSSLTGRQPEAAPTTAASLDQAIDARLARVIEQTVRDTQERLARPSPFDLNTFEEVERFCERFVRTELCPKDYRGKPDAAMAAVLMGKEVGLPAIAAIQSICVINGRPSIWGEAVPGLCMRTGQVADVVESFEDVSGDLTAVCTVTRRGFTPFVGRFSLADARTAGLGNVHRQYPRDMIMWRARHRAWRSAFPDVLKGMGTAQIDTEEASRDDWKMPHPSRGWFALRPNEDGWDPTYFNGLTERLRSEPNAWRWMEELVTSLISAPTLRDVEEIDASEMVVDVLQKAPEDARKTIEDALSAARARFADAILDEGRKSTPEPAKDAPAQEAATKPPAKSRASKATAAAAPTAAQTAPAETAAPKKEEARQEPPKQEEPAPRETEHEEETASFDYYVLNEQGEPASELIYREPERWARAFVDYFRASTNQDSLREQNADAIQDARADPMADDVLAVALDEQKELEPEPVAEIKLPIERGKPNWLAWKDQAVARIATLIAPQIVEFAAMHNERLKTAPQTARASVVMELAKRASALGVPPPRFDAATDAQVAQQQDRDATTLENFLEELARQPTADAVKIFTQGTGVVTVMNRWRSERLDLWQKMMDASAGRYQAFGGA